VADKPNENKTPFDATNRLLRQILSRLNKALTVDSDRSTGLRTATINVGASQPQILAPENKNRKRLTIKNINTDTNALYLSEKRNINATGLDAYVLNKGESKDFDFHTSEIWALASTGTVNATVAEE
jgi:hypothetical protein